MRHQTIFALVSVQDLKISQSDYLTMARMSVYCLLLAHLSYIGFQVEAIWVWLGSGCYSKEMRLTRWSGFLLQCFEGHFLLTSKFH
jgi:hypothetical protein